MKNRVRSLSGVVMVAMLLIGAAGLAGGVGCRSDLGTGPRHVVLISLDTVRRDVVSGGIPGSVLETPALDRLAASSVRFSNAFVQEPFTLSSHMSILTGLYPFVHGVDRRRLSLSESIPTLPEALNAAGFWCVGVASSHWLNRSFGFSRGFDRYQLHPNGLTFADRVTERGLALFDAAAARNQRVFLFLHYYDAHSDYASESPESQWPYYSSEERLERYPDEAWRSFCVDEVCASKALVRMDLEDIALTTEQLDLLRDLYSDGVAVLDEGLARLFDGLEGRGVLDDSLVIVTSDHGEEFREHGRLLHSQPYVENLAVPLLFRLPGGQRGGSIIGQVVETIDLFPTILDLLDLPVPPSVQGRSLEPLINGGELPPSIAFGRDKLNRERLTLRTKDKTLIWDRSVDTVELFERVSDPGELRDIADRHPDVAHELRDRIQVLLDAGDRLRSELVPEPVEEKTILTPAEEENLRALGYTE